MTRPTKSVAIVGAGLAGLTLAWRLRDRPDIRTTLFEKSRGVAGRLATRRREGACYDHGAQYFRRDRLPVEIWDKVLVPAGPVEIPGPVDLFDGGSVVPGDATTNASPRFGFESGINQLGKSLIAQSVADVKRQTQISSLRHREGLWEVLDSKGNRHGPFDGIVMAIPGPQARRVLEASAMEAAPCLQTIEALSTSSYDPVMAIILGYDRPLPRPGNAYAILNKNPDGPIRWIGYESDKTGHAPSGETILVLHASADWSRRHFRDSVNDLAASASREVSDMLDTDFGDPSWVDKQGWLFGLSNKLVDPGGLKDARALGLFFAGDSFVESRIEHVIDQATTVAGQVADYFSK